MRRFLLGACGILLVLLAGCASRPVSTELELRLSPVSLGRELALQQRMTVTAAGRSQQLDVALEADASTVRLVVLAFGQTLARMEWDGRTLNELRAPGWPASVTGGRVLSDLQLVHWPPEAIRTALPAGWELQSAPGSRTLRAGGATMVQVRYPSLGAAEIEHVAARYRVRLEPWPEAR